MKTLLLPFSVLCIALAGCSSNSASRGTIAAKNSADSAVVQQYLKASQLEMLSLTQQNSDSCLSGQMNIAYRLLTQTEQEVAGKMYDDAFISLVKLDRQIRKVKCIHDYLDGKFGCSQTNKTAVMKRWYQEGSFLQCKTELELVRLAPITDTSPHNIVTETLHDFDQDAIKPLYFPSLDKLVALMLDFPASSLAITGHTDSSGSAAYNDSLSHQRAQNVGDYFVSKGVPQGSIVIASQGESALREQEQDLDDRVFNRYTKISLTLDTRFPTQFVEVKND